MKPHQSSVAKWPTHIHTLKLQHLLLPFLFYFTRLFATFNRSFSNWRSMNFHPKHVFLMFKKCGGFSKSVIFLMAATQFRQSWQYNSHPFVLRSNHTVYLCRSLKWGRTTDAWIELWCSGCIVCRGKRTGKRSSYREWFARDRILKNRKSIIRPYKSYIKTAQKQTNEKTNKNKAGSIR